MKKIFIALFLSIVLMNCSGKNETSDSEKVILCPKTGLWEKEGKQIDFEEILDINPDNYDSVFAHEKNIIRTDKNNNIYLSDRNGIKIYKFDKNGNYINKFLRKGQGPGEINYILDFYIDDDNIYLFNSQNNSIMQYNCDGEFIKNIKLGIETSLFSTSMVLSKDNFHLFGRYETDTTMFHLFDTTGNYIQSFGQYQIIEDVHSDFELDMFLYNGNIWMKNSLLYYTNMAYDNKIYIYKNNQITKMIETNNFGENVYYIKTISKYDQKFLQKFEISIGDRDGSYTGLNTIKSSQKILVLSNGTLLNFCKLMNDGKDQRKGQKQYVEIFNSDFEYCGCFELEDKYYYFSHVDKNDFIYAHKYENEQYTYVKLKMIVK